MLAGLEKLCTFVKHFMDFHLNGGLSPTNKGISAHTGMPFLIEREPQGYFDCTRGVFKPQTLYAVSPLEGYPVEFPWSRYVNQIHTLYIGIK